MMSVAHGLALLAAGGLPLYNVPDSLVNALGFGAVLGIPASSLLAFATMVVGAMILRGTIFGRHVYAVGSNASAARNSGVRVRRVTLAVHALSGTVAGIAGVVMTAWVSAAQPAVGD